MTYSITKRFATMTLLCTLLASSLMWNTASASTLTKDQLIAQLKAQLVVLQSQLISLPTMTANGPKPSSSQIQVGDRVEVISLLKVRATPDTTGTVLGYVKDHVQGTVIEQSLTNSASGFTWWKVAYDTGLTGWSAAPWLREVTTGAPENNPSCQAFYFSPSTISKGQSTVATWDVSANGTVQLRSTAGDFNGNLSPKGTNTFTPATTTTYTITGVGKDGNAISCVATVIVKQTPASSTGPSCDYAYFTPAAVQIGQSTTLNWKVSNANKVVLTSSLKDVNKDFGTSGTYVFTPAKSAIYTLTAFGADGTKTTCASSVIVDETIKTAIKDAKKATCDSFTFTPSTTKPGRPVVMTWSTTNGIYAISTSTSQATNNYNFPLNGTYTIYPLKTSENSLTVFGEGGTANRDTCYATVTVTN